MSDILVIDDEEVLARSIVSFMERRGFAASFAVDARSAMVMAERHHPRLVILDVRLGRDNGLDLLGWFQSVAPETQIVVMTGHGEIGIAVDAMKRGARDFLVKPAPLATIAGIAANLMLQDVARPADARGVDRILGRSSAAVDLRSAVRRLAPTTDAPPTDILVTGPRGSGKTTIARAIHDLAKGDRGPMTEADCQLGDADLDLALEQRGGTLILRNVDALKDDGQARLMRGLSAPDAPWVLATTASNLAKQERNGLFRADLLYRIQIGWIDIPALHERSSDILPIAEAFARQSAQKHGRDRPRLTPDARVKLMEHDWPGNLRELANCMERAGLLAGNAPIDAAHIQLLSVPTAADVPKLVQMEEMALTKALAATRGNVSRAAALLGISRDTLRYRIEKYDISRPQG
ncbi:sigma-54-dependent transcriptional regulator [Loktanella sp. DJP18]|uniref:sigma-54-dependent transcriptional regulator n=1 Tax=Loktanella sp. DJP18 TaxID=3409788 RepID=UPI003BB80491